MRLNRYHWGMAVGVTGMIGVAAYLVYDFLDKNGDYGDAGSFFDFAYGVPIAAISAAVTFALAWVGHIIAGQQGDIEILKFVEEKVRPTLEHHQKLAVALGEIARVGDRAEGISDWILDCLPEGDGPGRKKEGDIFAGLLDQMAAKADDETIKAILAANATHIQRWARNRTAALGETEDETIEEARLYIENALKAAGEAVHDLHRAIRNINDAFAGISGDLYASMFSRNAFKAHAPEGMTPVRWLKARFDDPDVLPDLLEDSLPDIDSNLRLLSQHMVARELVAAVLNLPRNPSPLEIMGAIMCNYRSALPAGVPKEQVEVLRYNLGAAYFLTAYLYLPDPATMRETFTQLFGDRFGRRREVALSLLNIALPDRSQLGIARLEEIMKIDDAKLNRLIVIQPRDGPPEFYAPGRRGVNLEHKPAKTEPPFFSVRRLFNRPR